VEALADLLWSYHAAPCIALYLFSTNSVCEVRYKDFSFDLDLAKNMATMQIFNF
jgi:hypothetical protein